MLVSESQRRPMKLLLLLLLRPHPPRGGGKRRWLWCRSPFSPRMARPFTQGTGLSAARRHLHFGALSAAALGWRLLRVL
jgi:hypothetical protein